MRIAVVGAGGVGGYIGAKLSLLDDEVIFIARGAHADAIRSNGITIEEDDGTFTAHPDSVVSAEKAQGYFDLLLLCVKSYDIENAVKSLRKNISCETVIIPFSNGVEHAADIASMSDAKVLHGAVYILAHKKTDGVIRKKGSVFAAVFGDRHNQDETAMAASVFKKAGLRCKTPEDIEGALWKKYIFISSFASLTSYYNQSIKAVYDNHGKEAKKVLSEIVSVAAAKGIDLSDEVEKSLQTASRLPQDASTSMHLDFQLHGKTELETLCGYVVREAGVRGIEVPMMQEIYTFLKNKKDY
jgi:2-dehydropantoate 2-reductase